MIHFKPPTDLKPKENAAMFLDATLWLMGIGLLAIIWLIALNPPAYQHLIAESGGYAVLSAP